MTQNIYDDSAFFEAYSRLPRSIHGLEGAPEWPSMRAMLPSLRGSRVLDLGCGYGWFSRWAHEHGARSVVGVDVSQRMLERAREQTHAAAISYVQADLQHFDYPHAQFDLAYSSLALHYLDDLEGVLAGVQRALVAGASFVFSVEHPIFTAPKVPGWITHPNGHRTWPIDAYFDEGSRSTRWLTDGVIKRHRTLETYVRLLLERGFALTELCEWAPSEEQVAQHPEWTDERQRPPFLLVACRRS